MASGMEGLGGKRATAEKWCDGSIVNSGEPGFIWGKQLKKTVWEQARLLILSLIAISNACQYRGDNKTRWNGSHSTVTSTAGQTWQSLDETPLNISGSQLDEPGAFWLLAVILDCFFFGCWLFLSFASFDVKILGSPCHFHSERCGQTWDTLRLKRQSKAKTKCNPQNRQKLFLYHDLAVTIWSKGYE